jgi:hypothetical protein
VTSASRALLAAAALSLSGRAALAEEPPANDAAKQAEASFEEGKRLLKDGQVALACGKLDESERLDPSLGTLGLLATCHEQQGRLATAYREYRETARVAHATGDEREAVARQRADAIERAVPRIIVRAARPIPFLEVTLDGEHLAPSLLGTEILLDPGTVRVQARAPSRKDFSAAVTLAPNVTATLEIPDLAPTDATEPKGPPAVAPAGASSRRTIGFVAGGAGFVSLAIGAGLAFAAAGKNGDSKVVQATCTTEAACAEGKSLRDDAFRAATFSTIAFGVGLAGLGAGTVLILYDKAGGGDRRSLSIAPRLAPGAGGATVTGSF